MAVQGPCVQICTSLGQIRQTDALESALVMRNAALTGLGEMLARNVLDGPDQGHRSDMAATNRWAEELGLTGWFKWQTFQESQ